MTNHAGSITSYLHYYDVLGLQPGAGMQEIKHAYRTLAKHLHPDINKAPDAQEQFIEINEAYEFLIRLKQRSTTTSSATTAAGRRYSSTGYGYGREQRTAEELFREWLRKERQKARRRAAREARKKYNEFKKSTIYKTSQVISAVYDYIFVVVGIMVITGALVGFFTQPHEPTILDSSYPKAQQERSLFNTIVITVLLVFIGGLFTFFAAMNIRDRRKDKKNER